MNRLRLPMLLLTIALLTGCIVLPVPHVTKKSPLIEGRVLDVATGKPIDDAVVQLTRYSDAGPVALGIAAKTGVDGQFRSSAKYNFHVILYANVSWAMHIPEGDYWDGGLWIMRDGYEPLSFQWPQRWRDTNVVHVGELKLTK